MNFVSVFEKAQNFILLHGRGRHSGRGDLIDTLCDVRGRIGKFTRWSVPFSTLIAALANDRWLSQYRLDVATVRSEHRACRHAGTEAAMHRPDQAEEAHFGAIPSSILDYLDDGVALPACVFPNSILLGSADAFEALTPVHQNPAMKSLLSEGTNKDSHAGTNGHRDEGKRPPEEVEEAHKIKAHLRDALDEATRIELVEWLVAGVRESIKLDRPIRRRFDSRNGDTPERYELVRSSSAFSPAGPRIHRDRGLQLSTDVAFAKLYWRATHSGNENDGYTILTQLPIGHFAVRSSWEPNSEETPAPAATAKTNGDASSVTPSAHAPRHLKMDTDKDPIARGKIMIGTLEVDAEKAKDPNTLEGMAYTLFHAPIGIFRVNNDLSITMANPSWRNTCGQFDSSLERESFS